MDDEPHLPRDAQTSPLWPLVTILGEIAVRVCRRDAEERAPTGDDDTPASDAA